MTVKRLKNTHYFLLSLFVAIVVFVCLSLYNQVSAQDSTPTNDPVCQLSSPVVYMTYEDKGSTLNIRDKNGLRTTKLDSHSPIWFEISPSGRKIAYLTVKTDAQRIYVYDIVANISTLIRESTWTEWLSSPTWVDENRIVYGVSHDVTSPTFEISNLVEKSIRSIPIDGDFVLGLDVSPDGKTLAYTRTQTEGKDDSDLFLMDLSNTDSQPIKKLTTDGGNNSPIWSPDGTQIVYEHSVGITTTTLRVVDVNLGTSRDLLINGNPLFVFVLGWSRNGRFLTFAGYFDSQADLGRYDLETDNYIVKNTVENDGFAQNSPDGTQMVYNHLGKDGLPLHISVMNSDLTGEPCELGIGSQPGWLDQ